MKQAGLIAYLGRLGRRSLSIFLAVGLLAFSTEFPARADVCEDAFARHALVSTEVRGFVSETDDGFRFEAEKFGRAWAKLLTSIPGDMQRLVTESPVRMLHLRPRSASGKPALRLLLTAGVHGSEPLGTQTSLDVVSLILRDPHLRQKIELVLLPTLNYQGLVANTRNRIDGSDLNRSFSEQSGDRAIADIKKAIGDKSFDVALDLHGANRRKHFFVIKSDVGDTLAARALTAFDSTLLLRADNGEATGAVGAMTTGVFDPNRYWLEAPGLSISTNAGTLKSYAYALGTPHSYTVEYPGNLDLTLAREKNLELVLGLITEALRQK